jgi:3-(3-hydroxy-phenyl)propionate hydroxylase
MLLEDETDEQVTDIDFARQLLREHGPDEHVEIVRKQVYTFHARMANEWKKDRAFLLGDAEHHAESPVHTSRIPCLAVGATGQ